MTIDETDVAIDENWWKLMKTNKTLTTIDENWWNLMNHIMKLMKIYKQIDKH